MDRLSKHDEGIVTYLFTSLNISQMYKNTCDRERAAILPLVCQYNNLPSKNHYLENLEHKNAELKAKDLQRIETVNDVAKTLDLRNNIAKRLDPNRKNNCWWPYRNRFAA